MGENMVLDSSAVSEGWPVTVGESKEIVSPDAQRVIGRNTGFEAAIERKTSDPMERLVYLAMMVAAEGKPALELEPAEEILPIEACFESSPVTKGRCRLDGLDIAETFMVLETVLGLELPPPESLPRIAIREIADHVKKHQPPPIPAQSEGSPLSVKRDTDLTCKSCSAPLQLGAVICINCGTNQSTGEKISGALPTSSVSEQPSFGDSAPGLKVSSPDEEQTHCPQCQRKLPFSGNCMYCGTEDAEATCVHCNRKLPAGGDKCVFCGTNQQSGVTPKQNPYNLEYMMRIGIPEPVALRLADGYRLVNYKFCISCLVTLRLSSRLYLVKHGKSGGNGFPYLLISLICGWWGFPYGIIRTLESITNILGGGTDVTEVALRGEFNPSAFQGLVYTPVSGAGGEGQGAQIKVPTPKSAIASVVLGVIGLIVPLFAFAGVLCGHVALSKIKKFGAKGRGIAYAGLSFGYVSLALHVCYRVLKYFLLNPI